jgi:hypothetical protein
MGGVGRPASQLSQIVTGVLAVAITGGIVSFFFSQFRYNPVARQELRQAFSTLHLGDSPTQVRQSVQRRNYRYLKLRRWKRAHWALDTPLEWGAKNWVLHLDFNGNALVAKRVRIADHVTLKPRGATFPDEIAPKAKLQL